MDDRRELRSPAGRNCRFDRRASPADRHGSAAADFAFGDKHVGTVFSVGTAEGFGNADKTRSTRSASVDRSRHRGLTVALLAVACGNNDGQTGETSQATSVSEDPVAVAQAAWATPRPG